MYTATVQVLEWADTAVCLVFLIDFLVQLYKAQSKLQYLKWGWIDLVSSIPTIGMLRWGRLVRVVRIVRLVRGVRSVKTIAKYLTSRRADSAFAVAAFLAMLTVVLSSVASVDPEDPPETGGSTPASAVTVTGAIRTSAQQVLNVTAGLLKPLRPVSTDDREGAAV